MLKEFEIVDGVAKGYATASVEISFEIPLCELRHLNAQAEDKEEFLDLIQDEVECGCISYIETEIDTLGYSGGSEVELTACNHAELFEVELEDVDVEETEIEDD